MPRLVDSVVQPGVLSGTDQPDVPVDERLLLRPWNEGDIPAVVNAYAERDIQAWNLNSMDEAKAHEWIRSWSASWKAETDACWAIADNRISRLSVELRFDAFLWLLVRLRSPIG